jgi:hypothetical protein
MKTNSTSFDNCHHVKTRHSDDGFTIIHECPECCAIWKTWPSGDIARIYGLGVLRLVKQKMERNQTA